MKQPRSEKLEQAISAGIAEFPGESLLLLNEQSLRDRARLLLEHFIPAEEGGLVAYAIKANGHRRILEILLNEGLRGFDCASTNEIALAQEMSPTASVLYNHPIKKEADIAWAIEHGVRHFTAQSRRGIVKILASKVDPTELDIAVRLATPNRKAKINLSEKFGTSAEEAASLIRLVRDHGANPGISMHTGSQNTDPRSFTDAIALMSGVARDSGGVRTFNIGGGLPANIHESDDYDLRTFLSIISDAIRKNISGVFSKELPANRQNSIIIEPGRAMVAEAVDLLIPILEIERRDGQRSIYMEDGIFTSFCDAPIHDWVYPFKALPRNGKKLSENMAPFTLFGRTCDSGDTLGTILLPENLEESDYLHVPSAGAYMSDLSSKFCRFNDPRNISYNQ